MSRTEAAINEVFNSLQGEGIYCGERQTFIRFAGCNIACEYCDSPLALDVSQAKHYSVDELVAVVNNFEKPKGVNHSLSLTGGEPLLQVDFLKDFIPAVKKSVGLPLYLETNGTLPKYLEEIIDLVEIVAMDIKLPSGPEQQKFLAIAARQKVFVKIVVLKETTAKEIDFAVSLIAAISDAIPLVLQPVTPHGSIKHRPAGDHLMTLQAVAKRKLKEVRVIPQLHRLLGVS